MKLLTFLLMNFFVDVTASTANTSQHLTTSSTLHSNITTPTTETNTKVIDLAYRLELILKGISLILAFISLLLLILLRRLASSVKFFLHKQLLTAYCISSCLLFLQQDDLTIYFLKSTALCTATRLLNHYFLTSLFTCMLAEGLHITIKLMAVFNTSSQLKECLLYASVGWGFPLVVILVELAIWFKEFNKKITFEMLTTFDRCFYVDDRWVYKGPVAFILTANLVCFIMIIHAVMRSVFNKARNNTNITKLKATIRSVLVMYPLLGVTYILGFFLSPDEPFLLILFAVVNGNIGTAFFVLHILCDSQVRTAFIKQVFSPKQGSHSSNMTMISTLSPQLPKRKHCYLSNKEENVSVSNTEKKLSDGGVYTGELGETNFGADFNEAISPSLLRPQRELLSPI